MIARVLSVGLIFAFAPPVSAESEPEQPDQNAAVTMFERLIPGLKIESIGVAEILPGGGTQFVGRNDFEFTTKSGEVIRAQGGRIAIEPEKNLVTLARRPTIRLKTHSLIATADETTITYRTDTGKVKASGPHRIAIGIGKK